MLPYRPPHPHPNRLVSTRRYVRLLGGSALAAVALAVGALLPSIAAAAAVAFALLAAAALPLLRPPREWAALLACVVVVLAVLGVALPWALCAGLPHDRALCGGLALPGDDGYEARDRRRRLARLLALAAACAAALAAYAAWMYGLV